jgi:hypothetical protein
MEQWAGDASDVLELRILLTRMAGLLEYPARCITCLESSHSTLADVFLFWLSAAASISEFLSKAKFPFATKKAIYKATNARFTEMVHTGPSDAYLTALYLHWGTLFILFQSS